MKANKGTSSIVCFSMAVCLYLCNDLAVLGQSKPMAKTTIHFVARDWNKILALSRQQHKLIFVDAYAAWCAPCQDLKIRTFADPGIAAYFNKHFINVTMDMEKGEGLKFADNYEVNSYPSLLFIDGNGKLIKKEEGFADPEQLAKIAAEIKY